MTMPEPPASPEFFSESDPPAPKKKSAFLAPLVLACIIIGFAVGWVVAPEGTVDPLNVLHERLREGCVPSQYSVIADAPIEAARTEADKMIQTARAQGAVNAGYLVSSRGPLVYVTLYAEDCEA